MNTRIPVIIGPTASGKTRLAVALADSINAEIISADSRQVYKDMTIGTGKDLSDFMIHEKQIPYHLIDIREAGEKYNLHEFLIDFRMSIEDITNRDRRVVVCGGTGLYIEAALKNYPYASVPVHKILREELSVKSKEELLDIFNSSSSAYHSIADVSTKKRLIRAIEISNYLRNHPVDHVEDHKMDYILIGIDIPREERRKQISERFSQRLKSGMIEEVKSLMDKGLTRDQLVYYGLEYKFISQYLSGEFTYEAMIEHLEIAIHQYAKRQMTYFRKMEKGGLAIHWIDGTQSREEQLEKVLQIINS
jgi:tRNA dimethylallyltransferase